MTDLRKAAEMALEALEICFDCVPLGIEKWTTAKEHKVRSADVALRQALEQPECNPHPDAPHGFNRESSHSLGRYVCDCEGWEPEEQEPVSYIYEYTTPNGEKYYSDEYHDAHPSRSVPVYLTPPKRELVGLNNVEVGRLTVFDGLHHVETLVLADFIRAIEAKLREKNGF